MSQREIKFRAWNEYQKKMYEPSVIHNGIGEGESEHPLMQFTGLKDKNYNDIYDGDIVKMDEEAVVKPNENLVVEHDNFCTYWLRPTNENSYIAQLYESVRDHIGNHKQKHGLAGVVIGNIYENPELLK